MNQPYASRTHEKMKEVLMSPDAQGPAIHYYMIRGGVAKKNITVWETGKVGDEYIKTYGHYHVDDIKETYTILSGQGILLLQTRQKDATGNFIDDKITDFKAIKVKAGDIIAIPPFAGHAMVNIGSTWLVTSDDSPFNATGATDKVITDSPSMPAHADYEPMRKMHGFAYYVVEKNGEPTLVKNQNYSEVPEAQIK